MDEAPEHVPTFAPDDPTDGRGLRDWKSRYPDDVRRQVKVEATYLVVLLLACPALLAWLWLAREMGWFHVPPAQSRTLWMYGTAWVAGMLGGTLFDLKWLYHSVARQLWNEDRRWWRLFTPHISTGLSFIMVALVASGLGVFDKHFVQNGCSILGFGSVVGYFSDSAIGKLSELADTLLGSKRRDTEQKPGGKKRNQSRKEDAAQGPEEE